MKNETLDEAEDYNYPKFAIKSFKQFIYSVSVVVGFVAAAAIFFVTSILGDVLSLILMILLLSAFISSILGLINAIKSKSRKERNHWKKYVGGVGSLILLLFFMMMILVLFLDFYDVFIR
jgi:hypothetical protein